MSGGYSTIKDFPDYEIRKDGTVRDKEGNELKSQLSSARKPFYRLRIGNKVRHRSLNVLLFETFGPGAAAKAGYPEPDPKRIATQRKLAQRPRSGKSLGTDGGPPKYSRQCHDCKRPTNNYRCNACWRKIRGFGMAGTRDYHNEL